MTDPARPCLFASMSLRVFAALPLPPEIVERVLPLMKGVPGAKWRPPENLHITLAFYGELDEDVIEELDLELGRIAIPPFELRLEGTGHFGKAEPSALWLGVSENPLLLDLARRCAKAGQRAGAPPDKRNYHAHVTIAYLGETDFVRLQKFEKRLNLYRSEPFVADRFHLYSSRQRKPGKANVYEVEAEYPLLA
ncbi:RNA 2',3'-cyclic phosphodiesterase [Marinicauda salina]|uniref:RNA 2',3'-cyclic phosphodiesterase n=2 Tax=Marinicauda salina TaxID=2135793 RepID=A0A2U2BX28_9PROT|nr:RNA 2',3'-cyclic phosphodiesterase [Marinicauda salina]